MRHTALVLIAAAALLSACGKSEDATPSALEPPADAPAPAPVVTPAPATDVSRPINALGTEPFWALKIRPEGLNFSEPQKPEMNVKNPGPKITGETAVWSGQGVEATLTAGVCQDGMSDRSYPFKAVVKVGGKTLNGCATYADDKQPPA